MAPPKKKKGGTVGGGFTFVPKKKGSGYVMPVPGVIHVGRNDHGVDYQGTVGSNVVAIGNARVDYIGLNVQGYGYMVVYTLTSGSSAGKRIFVGHAAPVANLQVGQKLSAGDPVATLLQTPGGDASKIPGWVEVGIASDTSFNPAYPKEGGVGGIEFKKLLGQKLTAQETATASTYQSTVTNTTQAGSPGYNQSAAEKAAALQAAKQQLHVDDPWVTVIKDKNGRITGFGSTTGYAAPGNVLMYAGEPVTKSVLSSIWGARYADIYEEFTGKTPQAPDVAFILGKGLSGPGLMQYLSKQPGFQHSPIWMKTAHGIQQTAQNILGANVSASFVKQAIAGQWDQQTIEYNMRRYKTPSGVQPYLTGPEYTANSASLKGQYQKIYGLPDAVGNQAIGEAAASGWTADAFGSYLRSLPQYKTSLEYQSNAVAFLDQLGLLVGAGPGQLQRGDNITPSLQTVPNSPLVPGKPAPINASLPFTPTLAPPGKAP